MNLTLYIGPMDVSFQGIDVSEIPCASIVTPVGYYATTNFTGVLSHTADAGAGLWHHIKEGNRWGIDNAASNIRTPPWSEGRMTWKIPVQWYKRLDSPTSWPERTVHPDGKLIGGSESAYLQVFEITADGTIKISKHGHWIDRTTEDVIRLDGKKVHGGIHLW